MRTILALGGVIWMVDHALVWSTPFILAVLHIYFADLMGPSPYFMDLKLIQRTLHMDLCWHVVPCLPCSWIQGFDILLDDYGALEDELVHWGGHPSSFGYFGQVVSTYSHLVCWIRGAPSYNWHIGTFIEMILRSTPQNEDSHIPLVDFTWSNNPL